MFHSGYNIRLQRRILISRSSLIITKKSWYSQLTKHFKFAMGFDLMPKANWSFFVLWVNKKMYLVFLRKRKKEDVPRVFTLFVLAWEGGQNCLYRLGKCRRTICNLGTPLDLWGTMMDPRKWGGRRISLDVSVIKQDRNGRKIII